MNRIDGISKQANWRKPVLALFSMALLAFGGAAFAQQQSSALTGQVTNAKGEAIEGATVTVLHVPSGTRRQVTTGASGKYLARGLRVGGPYTVTISASGYKSESDSGIELQLGEALNLDGVLSAEGVEQLETVQVTGFATSGIFSPDNKGASTIINDQQLRTLPSISRSIFDFVRLDPRLKITDKERNEISAAGQNSRFNNISIDGVGTNDLFGLEASGLPALNNPISLDTIEQINVKLNPIDVALGGFTGASINAVTKSGTNDFNFVGNFVWRNQGLVSSKPNKFGDFKDYTATATVSGPIIEDTLFFFFSWEEARDQRTAEQLAGLAGSGATTITDVDPADVAEIIDIAKNVWGFDPGSATTVGTLRKEDTDILAKLDWNINDFHRASVRWSQTNSNEPIVRDRDRDDFSLTTNFYTQQRKFQTVVGQVFSDWTDSLSTELKVSWKKQTSAPTVPNLLPEITVDVPRLTSSRTADIVLGTDQFRHANRLNVRAYNVFASADYFMGDHTLRFGMDWQLQKVFNLFVESSAGVYQFNGVDNFRQGFYGNYSFRIGSDPDNRLPAANWQFSTIGFFLQDTYDVTPNFQLQYGIRYDRLSVPQKPRFNSQFENTFGIANNTVANGADLFAPRFGFNWDLGFERRTQVRFGAGLFLGTQPSVWLSNPFSNDGVSISTFQGRNQLGFSPDPLNQPTQGLNIPVAADVDVVSPNFALPSVWRFNLAVEHELPWYGVIASVEFLDTQVHKGIHYTHLNLGEATGTLPDGRLSFAADPSVPLGNFAPGRANRDPNFREVLLLSNTTKGSSSDLTFSLEKPFENGLYMKLAYNKENSTEVSPGTSSRAISNWNNRAVFNPNEEEASTANNEIKDRYTFTMSYAFNAIADLTTTVGVFGEYRSGRPYSFVFNNDANGDGINDTDLVYVPSGPGDVIFTGGADMEAAFLNFVDQNPYLSKHKGEVFPRNGARSPRIQQWDLNISQELPTFGFASAKFFVNVLNFANILNHNWGRVREVNFPQTAGLVTFAGIDDVTGRYIFDFDPNDVTAENILTQKDRTAESRWSLQLGFRFEY